MWGGLSSRSTKYSTTRHKQLGKLSFPNIKFRNVMILIINYEVNFVFNMKLIGFIYFFLVFHH